MKFTDIVEFSGKTCSTFDGKKNYISTGCVHDNHICKDEIETVEYINKPSRANLVVEPGDILFAKMQATKKTLLINEDLSQNIYSTGFYAVKPKDGLITKKCLFYLINSSLFLGEKDKNCSGATQKAINNQGLSSIELNIPEFSVQKLLTQKLDVLSKAIEVKQSQIRFFDNLIKARFVEMFGNLEDNAFNYPVKTIQEVCEQIKDGTHQTPTYTDDRQSGYIFLSSKDVTSGKVDWCHPKYIPEDLHRELYARVSPKKGDILLAKNGTTGVAAIVDKEIVFDIYVSLALLRPHDVNEVYLWAAINSDGTKKQFNSSLKGIGVSNLHLGEIRKTRIIIPPIDLQNQFATFVTQIDKSKFAVQKSLEKTQLLFDSLMQEYFG